MAHVGVNAKSSLVGRSRVGDDTEIADSHWPIGRKIPGHSALIQTVPVRHPRRERKATRLSARKENAQGAQDAATTQLRASEESLRREAMEEYVIPQVDVLYRVALSLTRNPADAQDLVQETLLRAFMAIDRFDGQHPRAWLLTILKNVNINWVRRKRPELYSDLSDLPMDSKLQDQSDSPESIVIDRSFDPAIAEAFSALPHRLSDVVRLVAIDGLSYEETSAILSIPIGTVMSRLHRARMRMRKTLAESGFSASGRTNEDSA